MTDSEFEAIVDRLEAQAKKSWGQYRLRVALLGLLGYGYVGAILLLALGLLAGVVALVAVGNGSGAGAIIRIGLPVVILIFIVLRAFLWINVPPPDGILVTRSQAQALFIMVEKVGARMKAEKVHGIVINGEFNAGAYQVPRLGILGWPKNYLVLGLPLMRALSADQFQSVLAHELAHLSRRQSRIDRSVHFKRIGWSRLLEQLESRRGWGILLLLRFYRSYAPFFGAYSFVLARAHEYEADKAAADLSGKQVVGDTLAVLAMKSRVIDDRFWHGMWKAAAVSPEPDSHICSSMGDVAAAPLAAEEAKLWLEDALESPSTCEDVHPSISERLKAIGAEARLPVQPPTSAAEELLRDSLPALSSAIDRELTQAFRPSWAARFKAAEEARSRLAELDSWEALAPLEIDDAWERARIKDHLEGPDAALTLYRRVLEQQPDHAGALLALGGTLTERGDGKGLTYLDSAMQANELLTPTACQLAYDFLRRNGRRPEAAQYHDRAAASAKKLRQARIEREKLRPDDRYLPHGLDTKAVSRLSDQLAKYLDVTGGYLVRRHLELFPDYPQFVLGVEIKRSFGDWLSGDGGEKAAALQEALARDLDGLEDTYVIVLSGAGRKHRKVFTAVQGGRIYP